MILHFRNAVYSCMDHGGTHQLDNKEIELSIKRNYDRKGSDKQARVSRILLWAYLVIICFKSSKFNGL